MKITLHDTYHSNYVIVIGLCSLSGVGVAPGSVVISSGALNGELREEYVQWIAGKKVIP